MAIPLPHLRDGCDEGGEVPALQAQGPPAHEADGVRILVARHNAHHAQQTDTCMQLSDIDSLIIFLSRCGRL